MNRHLQGIIALGIVVALACAVGIRIVGTPVSQRLINFDNTRLGDFSSLRYRVEECYRSNSSLPLNLTDLERTSPAPKDPETSNSYEYQKVTDTSYKFCAVFSTDSTELSKNERGLGYPYPPIGTESMHKKGYDCITYTLPDYLVKPTPTPYDEDPVFRRRPTVTIYPTMYMDNIEYITPVKARPPSN